MSFKEFIKPTTEKIISTLIILGSIILANKLTDFISGFLIPEWMLNELINYPITDILYRYPYEVMYIGLKVLLTEVVIFTSLMYVTISIIFNIKSRKLRKNYEV